jgi:tetratricopeptide (TPR) repeat protein
MVGGQYASAIPVLREAVAAAAPGSLTYAYALFDLGRSLRLAGSAQAAIPVLRRRLEIPNQTSVVWRELLLALRAAGEGGPAGRPSGGASVAPRQGAGDRGGGHHGLGHGDGGGGGGD